MKLVEKFAALRALLSAPKWTRAQLEAFQSRRLRAVVEHAFTRVPFYRRLYREVGLHPEGVRGIEDLHKIPIVQKRDFIDNPEYAPVAQGAHRSELVSHRTNGSTGEPFAFYVSSFEDQLLSAFRLAISRSMGLRLTDKQVRVRLPPKRNHGWVASLLGRLKIARVYNVSTLLLPEEALDEIRGIRPDVISGLSGMLYQIALLMTEKDRELIRPRMIMPGGDTLTPAMRRRISEGFGARVREIYGSHEFNLIGWECSQTGHLHISDASVILEVVKGNEPAALGEQGEAVVTALHSFTQPFIRYRLGDLVTKTNRSCSCGLPYSTIRSLEGRFLDRLLFPGDRLVSPDIYFSQIEKTSPWVRQYQITQSTRDSVVLQLVPFETPSRGRLAELQEALMQHIPDGIRLGIRVVDRIEAGPGGKTQLSRNLLTSPYSDLPESASGELESGS